MFKQLPYNENKRILIDLYDGTTTDITVYILEIAKQWFKENNYHITKYPLREKVVALAFIEDQAPLDFVEEFYKIKREDYTPTASEKELNNGLYKIKTPHED